MGFARHWGAEVLRYGQDNNPVHAGIDDKRHIYLFCLIDWFSHTCCFLIAILHILTRRQIAGLVHSRHARCAPG